MLALLSFIGLGFLIAEVADSGSSNGDGGSSEPQVFSNDADAVVDESYRGDIEANLLDLVAEGEISSDQSEQALDAINFRSGAINVDTAGGDDVVVAGEGDDTIVAGAGDDLVFGGAGNDENDLGLGNDVSGIDDRVFETEDDFQSFPTLEGTGTLAGTPGEHLVEGGDDRIFGGAGSDLISDNYGSNFIHGQQGDDLIITVDAADDMFTPDRIKGGFGKDTLVFDEGDSVETGRGFDTVVLDVLSGVDGEYQPAEVDDFEIGKDTLVIEGDAALIGVDSTITVRDLEDGTGAEVSIAGQPVMFVRGATGLTVDDIVVVFV